VGLVGYGKPPPELLVVLWIPSQEWELDCVDVSDPDKMKPALTTSRMLAHNRSLSEGRSYLFLMRKKRSWGLCGTSINKFAEARLIRLLSGLIC